MFWLFYFLGLIAFGSVALVLLGLRFVAFCLWRLVPGIQRGRAFRRGRVDSFRVVKQIQQQEMEPMPVSQKKDTVSKFPLRLMPSVRRVAEDFSQKEGVSLNQFINVAVAEKLARLAHGEWLAQRPKATHTLITKALEILDRPTDQPPEEFDKIPTNYASVRRKLPAKRAVGRRRG